jgi:hypothetical protein
MTPIPVKVSPADDPVKVAPADVEKPEESLPPLTMLQQALVSVQSQSWLASLIIHIMILVVLGLVAGTVHVAQTIGQAPEFEVIDDLDDAPEIAHFEVGNTPIEPTELNTETLSLEAPPVEAQFNDNSPLFEEAGGGVASPSTSSFGGLGGFDVSSAGLGPMLKGPGGADGGGGFSKNFGKGGAGEGFGTRGSGMREAMLGTGGTKQSERAVAAALNWIARHQNRDGSWSINHTRGCTSAGCSGPGGEQSDAAATALALLPFLAAGQTHESKGPYQRNIAGGVNWLIKNQKPTGDLSAGAGSQMYTHGLATIALCEAYGMTQDSRVGLAAQGALRFIETGQNREGGWRYTHGTDSSDLSVLGWQVMALKSGQMAGIKVNEGTLDMARRYVKSCASGQYGGEFSYIAKGGSTFTMTAVGLLTSQYMGARRDDPVIVNGIDYLLKNKPTFQTRNTYYWYYATQVLHNTPGPQWDEWNREMRKLLINTQDKKGCGAGSWDPSKPEPDPWANQGGRLMVTSFSTLTLEVYYRYLPLYKLDKDKDDLNKVE